MLFSDSCCLGIAFASVTVPLMWIAVINQNLGPLGMTQVICWHFYILSVLITFDLTIITYEYNV